VTDVRAAVVAEQVGRVVVEVEQDPYRVVDDGQYGDDDPAGGAQVVDLPPGGEGVQWWPPRSTVRSAEALPSARGAR
jgi:hypothetical protein